MTTLREPAVDAFVMHLQARFDLQTLVETGTYEGESTLYAAERFRHVVTIDISQEWHHEAMAACAQHQNVEFHIGDTRAVLPLVVAGLDGPALFWLDAHAAPDLFGERDDWPALEELCCIFESRFKHFILIDDAHCFLPGTPYPACPSMRAIEDEALIHDYAWRVCHDVLALVPAKHRMDLLEFGDAP